MESVRILLVDDDTDDKDVLVEALHTVNSRLVVETAENGEEALRLLSGAQADKIPSLIILDLNMPRLSGKQTLEAIKIDQRLKKVPVVIYSTSVNPIEKERCMALGAHSYITKPILYKECIATAEFLLGISASK